MTFSARFTVQDITQEPSLDSSTEPLVVRAVAEAGDVTANTEGKVLSMELRVRIDEQETVLKPGDVITASGHFVGVTPAVT